MGTTWDWWPGEPTMLSFVWMDRDCRYFVASASSQVSLELDALPENVELTIPQPKAMEAITGHAALLINTIDIAKTI